mmetsp:Transcript_8894/g.10146  ORF Transcript_8894/g.10146 Transcript_8894/m.10146 type:complete len:285 (+) Transcript_8894:71-925(+)|eukprot:CAMPEP_0204827290 /NCGR_PEP_ID=MMETSP1346-20131115/4782_1 /ASSEMBLY_ACC=CAM_ASM_000771 /TAXON_ID=215587 /ORGANISM="Aplanochytrium stocchinoi, Strain GSBS06" /LENGTH=284 /DNA_ID=CAMNT_0051955647 /DNA_START=85 /DNA_END=939 /DNA_ORIENTATION=-
MGERKVLNKYFPADFDPSKIPRRKFDYDAAQDIRMMLPFSLCCLTCGHYMYQGKKFNSKKETAKGMDYLGVKRLRFTIKCEVCNAKISFLTDPKNQDYECESGASRNFAAWRETKEDHNKTLVEKDKEKLKNSMEVLESRTLDSKREMDILDALDEIKTRSNQRQTVDASKVLDAAYNSSDNAIERKKEQEQQDEMLVKQVFKGRKKDKNGLKLLREDDSDEDVNKNDTQRKEEGSKQEEEVLEVREKKRKRKKSKKKKKSSKTAKIETNRSSLVAYADSSSDQ